MPITGQSQGKGVPRLLDVSVLQDGYLFHIHDRHDADREKILMPRQRFDEAFADTAPGVKTLEGTAPEGEARKLMDLEVREGAEVQLWIRTETGGGWDISVTMDDFVAELDQATGE